MKNKVIEKRGSGVLLHITSLPGPYGIGDLGPGAYAFADFLADTKQSYWQILPLTPTEEVYGYSPYSSPSAFAFNFLMLSPEGLYEDGWLRKSDLESLSALPAGRCDFTAVAKYKSRLIKLAFEHFHKNRRHESPFEKFCAQQKEWIDDYALFTVLKKYFTGNVFSAWPEGLRDRQPAQIKSVEEKHAAELKEVKFIQFLLFSQWTKLKDYCRRKGVALIGDIPIYVNADSADVWAHPEIFKLDAHHKPLFVAGVPPDYFSQTGQRWGNPVYDWERLRETRYQWWIERFLHTFELYDIVRIDHFRGFEAYWEIPAAEPTAVNGEWVKGPADDFFKHLKKSIPHLPVIAEDLGIITPEVTALMEQFGFPGMKILLFSFGGDLDSHPYNPKNYTPNCVVYTGTHDNNTARGWIETDTSGEERHNLNRYFSRDVSSQELPWLLIESAMGSVADTAIIPLQDLLGLGGEARMNQPGTVGGGNWRWRCTADNFSPALKERLREVTVRCRRA